MNWRIAHRFGFFMAAGLATGIGCSGSSGLVNFQEMSCTVTAVTPAVFLVAGSPTDAQWSLDKEQLGILDCLENHATRLAIDSSTLRQTMTLRYADAVDLILAGEPPQAPEPTIGQKFDELLAIQRELDQRIDMLIDQLYSTEAPAQPNFAGIDNHHILALALFDYARLTRMAYGNVARTQVRELADDPACQRDLIAERTLWRYFEAQLMARDDITAQAAAVRQLGTIAAQTVCIGSQQLYQYDLALTLAWYRLENRLNRKGLARLKDELAGLALQPRLLVLDATKHYGSQSPGHLWLSDLRSWRYATAEQRTWPTDERLWIYDRRAGNLVALDVACREGGTGTDCINLAVLLDSLATPLHLGFGECSALEMLEAGVRDVRGAPGYTCTSSLCGTPFAGTIAGTTLGSSFSEIAIPIGENLTLSRRGVGNTTPFGINVDEARGQLCATDGLGGDGGKCGVSAGAIGQNNPTLACLLKVRNERPATLGGNLVCLKGVARSCRSPSELLKEAMRPVFHGGVPMCQRAQAVGGTAQDIRKRAARFAEDYKKNTAERQRIKEAFESATGVRPTDQQIDRAANKLAAVTPVPRLAGGDYGVTDQDGNIEVAENKWVGQKPAVQDDTLQHEFAHSLANIMAKDKSIDPTTEEEDQEIMKRIGLDPDAAYRCDRQNPDCNNACGSISQQMQQALACATDLQVKPDPTLPGGGVTDPLPDDVSDPAWSRCLVFTGSISTRAVRQCSLAHCTDPDTGIDSSATACCASGGAPLSTFAAQHTQRLCEVVLCGPPDAAALSEDVGVCGCGGRFIPRRPPEPAPLVPIDRVLIDLGLGGFPLQPDMPPT